MMMIIIIIMYRVFLYENMVHDSANKMGFKPVLKMRRFIIHFFIKNSPR